MDSQWLPGLRADLQKAKKNADSNKLPLSRQSTVSREASRKAWDRLGITMSENCSLARGPK